MAGRKSSQPARAALAMGEAGPSGAAGARSTRSGGRAGLSAPPPPRKKASKKGGAVAAKKTKAAAAKAKKQQKKTKPAAGRRGDDEENAAPAPVKRGRGHPPGSTNAARATRATAAPAAAHDSDDAFQSADGGDEEATACDEPQRQQQQGRRGPAANAAAANTTNQQPPRRGRPPNPAGRFIGGPNSPARRAVEQAAARSGQVIPHHAQAAGAAPLSPVRRLAEQGVRAADVDQLEAARLRGNTVRLLLTVELSDDLLAAGAQFPDAAGGSAGARGGAGSSSAAAAAAAAVTRMVEVPALCEVRALRRYIHYYCGGCLPPAMQRLRDGLSGAPLHDLDARGHPNTLGAYGLSDGARVTLTVVPPETEEQQLAVGAALAGDGDLPASPSARAAAGLSPRRPGDPVPRGGQDGGGAGRGGGGGGGRNGAGRWTLDEMEALVGGIEAWGLSWSDVRKDPRLAARDGVNCKDKFRNMCLTVLQGRAERKVSMPFQIRERVTRLAERYNVRV